MEWIRISTNKLKIMLSAEDAKRYALRCDNADYADVLTRRAFREILTEIRKETGFDATEDKVYIQMYPSKEGGCELFVTKIGLLLSDIQEDYCKAKGKDGERIIRRSEPIPENEVFSFSSLDALLSVCRRLDKDGFTGKSEVWLDENGCYWLFLSYNTEPDSSESAYTYLSEYGNRGSYTVAEVFLPEHGRKISARDAVKILGSI